MTKKKPTIAVKRRPFIGVTLDLTLPPGTNALPRYELKRAYTDAVIDAGGMPILLPYTKDGSMVEAYLGLIEGLVVTGGAFDVPPELYGEKPRQGLGQLNPVRTQFELALLEQVLDRDIPVLGVCGGMQLMNVAFGGTLYQDLGRELPSAQVHEMKGDRRLPAHEVSVTAGTLLAAATGPGSLMVNSTHHQAVKRLGGGLIASAVAGDGVIEAIEAPDLRFAVGVQWHPELLVKSVPINRGLYRGLVRAAGERLAKTKAS
ncbi:MAG: gamma-glutamyl-gamma-aminobutyrate hydrolase family protein [Deltaproteobacteria bacterium]|nr:gamma-glutamyl-gamma-aminobutyrate hydrolase family protein [Deltaproteobacteria bacterium]